MSSSLSSRGWLLPVWKRERKRIRVLAAALVRLVSSRPLARRVVLSGVMSGRLETSLLPGTAWGASSTGAPGKAGCVPAAGPEPGPLRGGGVMRADLSVGTRLGLPSLRAISSGLTSRRRGRTVTTVSTGADAASSRRGTGRLTGVPMGMGSPTHSPAWRRLGLT